MMAFEGKRVLVTGGGGFVGFWLTRSILEGCNTCQVVVFDRAAPMAAELPPGATFVKGDVSRADDVTAAAAGCDIVFHVASYGMSGRELKNVGQIRKVNVQGTRNVVDACRAQGVRSLVYVSTCNVVFVGKTILHGDESAPYPKAHEYKDEYSRTKAQAERMVLGADETASASSSNSGDSGSAPRLRTCAIRTVGIYGPGETRHQPRIIRLTRAGLFVATFGPRESLVDWIHVDNLVQALKLAGEGLTPAKGHIAAGKAYYVSDNAPINNFEFFRPMIEGLGYRFPSLNLPYGLIYPIAALMELLWPLLNMLGVEPPFIRMEVDKVSVTHYFDIGRAQRELGYAPRPYTMACVVEQMAKDGLAAKDTPRRQGIGSALWVVLALVLALVALWVLRVA